MYIISYALYHNSLYTHTHTHAPHAQIDLICSYYFEMRVRWKLMLSAHAYQWLMATPPPPPVSSLWWQFRTVWSEYDSHSYSHQRRHQRQPSLRYVHSYFRYSLVEVCRIFQNDTTPFFKVIIIIVIELPYVASHSSSPTLSLSPSSCRDSFGRAESVSFVGHYTGSSARQHHQDQTGSTEAAIHRGKERETSQNAGYNSHAGR